MIKLRPPPRILDKTYVFIAIYPLLVVALPSLI